MSTEILVDAGTPAVPVLWRKVTLAAEDTRSSGQRNAEEELKRRLDQARREGLEEGLAAGRAESERQVPAILENVARAQAELARMGEQIRIETARELVRLARTAAARVIHREMVTDSRAIAGLVKAAYLKLQPREITRVRMHPAIASVVAGTLEQCGASPTIALLPDTGLSAGELLFETAQGTLDASLDTQLRELERGLMEKLGKHRTAGSGQPE